MEEEKKEVIVEEVVQDNNKKSNSKNIVIIILVLLVLGLSGFIVYDKVLSNKDIPKDEVKETLSRDNLTEEEAFELFDFFVGRYRKIGNINPLSYDKSVIKLSDLEVDDILGVIYKSIDEDDMINVTTTGGEFDMGGYDIKVSTLQEKANEYFGSEITLPDTYWYFPSACELKNDIYHCTNVPTGLEGSSGWNYFPVSFKQEDGYLYVEAYAAYDTMNGYATTYDSEDLYCLWDEINPDNKELASGESTRLTMECLEKNGLDKGHRITLVLHLVEDKTVFDRIEVK